MRLSKKFLAVIFLFIFIFLVFYGLSTKRTSYPLDPSVTTIVQMTTTLPQTKESTTQITPTINSTITPMTTTEDYDYYFENVTYNNVI
jgi:hypothetical protein